jgi:hypothetical protein
VAEIGRWVPLRTAPGEATFAQIEIEPTWLGRAVGLLLQPAIIQIAVKLADGRTLVHRLPRGLARAGFILSPLVANAEGYVALAAGDRDALAPSMVTGFQLLVPYDRGGEVEPAASVTLRRLTLPAGAQ